jgi:hypothetical protein
MRASLAATREANSLKQDRDIQITPESVEFIRLTERRIAELAQEIAHRHEQTKAAEQVLAKGTPVVDGHGGGGH